MVGNQNDELRVQNDELRMQNVEVQQTAAQLQALKFGVPASTIILSLLKPADLYPSIYFLIWIFESRISARHILHVR